MEQKYWINIRDKPAFLSRLMRELSSDDSQILLEGDLSDCEFQLIEKLDLSGELFGSVLCGVAASGEIYKVYIESSTALCSRSS